MGTYSSTACKIRWTALSISASKRVGQRSILHPEIPWPARGCFMPRATQNARQKKRRADGVCQPGGGLFIGLLYFARLDRSLVVLLL